MDLKDTRDNCNDLKIAGMSPSIKYNEKTNTLTLPGGEVVRYDTKTHTIYLPNDKYAKVDVSTGRIYGSEGLGSASIDWKTGQIYDEGLFRQIIEDSNKKYDYNSYLPESLIKSNAKKSNSPKSSDNAGNLAIEGAGGFVNFILIFYGVYLAIFYFFHKSANDYLLKNESTINMLLIAGIIGIAILSVARVKLEKGIVTFLYYVCYISNIIFGSLFAFHKFGGTLRSFFDWLAHATLSHWADGGFGVGIFTVLVNLFLFMFVGIFVLMVAAALPLLNIAASWIVNILITKTTQVLFNKGTK